MNGDRIRALRYTREIVYDMRWHGIPVPPLYVSMVDEFHVLVQSGNYAAWLSASEGRKPTGR